MTAMAIMATMRVQHRTSQWRHLAEPIMTDKRSKSHSPHTTMPEPPAQQSAMPMPTAAGQGVHKAGTAMPMPAMGAPASQDPMPRPGAAAASVVGDMPAAGTDQNRTRSAGPDFPRFAPPGGPSGPRYEPGVVEVQFREGLMPSVMQGQDRDTAPALRSFGQTQPAEVTLAEVNQILQRYLLVSAEPTFQTSIEQATMARATAQQQGIDAPHLSDFVTLHFPSNANVSEIAEQLNKLPQVERAVPVPSALPPTMTLAEAAPEMAQGASLEAAMQPRSFTPELQQLELPPTGNALNEPFVGRVDQVVVDASGRENQWYVFRCRANQAWAQASGKNVVIADVDWGCRASHQDLAPNIKKTYNAVDGSSDVTHGGSIFHGTGVLGLTGAAVNAKGMAGIAHEADLWAIQADSGPGPALGGNAWARGIDWVRTTNSGGKRKVIILEVQTGAFGNYEQVPSVNAAIKTAIAAGVVVCVAAGNGNRDAGLDDSGHAFPETGSILVGATQYDPTLNRRAGFSNWGSRIVLSAPGDSAHDVTCDSGSDSAYRNNFGGTSGATPKVAGVVALMLSVNPGLSHAQIRAMLGASGLPIVLEAGKPVGRLLNAEAAVRQASTGSVGRIEVFARGTDKALWHVWQTAPNNGWSGWGSMGGWVDIIKSARNQDGRLEMFVRGSDKALWHIWQTAPNNGWSGWASLGGWIDLIEVAQNADGRLEVFARGSDGAVWHRWQTAPNNGWSGWASLGGWVDRLSVAQNADGRIELFGRGSDGALWHKWQTAPNNGWSGWASMGGWIDMLDVGRNQDGRLEVFARGSDGALWHKWQTAPNNGWSGWASLGGWIDLLEVAQNADGRLEVFARGSDRALWHRWQTAPNNGWSGWASMGGWIDRLTASQNADGRLELFVRGSDKALWHNWQTAPDNGWSGWASMGGAIDVIAVAQNAA
jgi:subtilisin family serine protease